MGKESAQNLVYINFMDWGFMYHVLLSFTHFTNEKSTIANVVELKSQECRMSFEINEVLEENLKTIRSFN